MNLLKNRRGTIFLTTMICMFLMATTGSALYQMTTSDLFYVNRLKKSLQAQQLADAGLAEMLSALSANWGTAVGARYQRNLGPGNYDVSVSVVSSRYLVTSVGTVQGVSRTASAEVTAPGVSALDYVFAGGGTGTHVLDPGTGQTSGSVTGDIYMGGALTFDGPSSGGILAVTGDLYAAGAVNPSSPGNTSLSGSQNSNWSTAVSFPSVDFAYYQNIASSNGNYINGNITYGSGALPSAPAGGVIFVNGDVVIQGTQSTTACIVATGSITFSKTGNTYPRVTVNQYSNLPALMTQNGSITFTSTGNGSSYLTVRGLIYSGNNFTLTGNHLDGTNGGNLGVDIRGSVLARGTFSTSGLTADNHLTAVYVQQNPPGMTSGAASTTIRSYNR